MSNQKPNSKKGDLLSAKCPSREILDHVTSRWGTLILIVLLGGTYRFSELRRNIEGVSEKMLAQCLRALEADGFVLKKDHQTIPPKVEYSLTTLGRGVAERIEALAGWIESHMAQIERHQTKFRRKSSYADWS